MCMWKPTPITADVTVTKIAGYVCVRILMNRGFFLYFWHSYFLRYSHFVEYINIYACNELMQPTVVVGVDWTLHPWRHNSSNVGGVTACRAQHNSSNSVLPRPFLQGAAPCRFLVTPCPFQKAEKTPCPFDFKKKKKINIRQLLALFCPFCPHTAWIVLCIFYCAIQGHFWLIVPFFFRSPR